MATVIVAAFGDGGRSSGPGTFIFLKCVYSGMAMLVCSDFSLKLFPWRIHSCEYGESVIRIHFQILQSFSFSEPEALEYFRRLSKEVSVL